MTVDYQLSLLAYTVQYPDGSKYIKDLNEELFSLLEFKLALQLVKKFYLKYETTPSQIALTQFFEEQAKETRDITPAITQAVEETIEDIFVPLPESDRRQLQDTLIIEVQNKSIETTFLEYASGNLSTNQVFSKMQQLSSMVRSVNDEHSDGGFLIADRNKFTDEQVIGNPTFLDDLNDLTAAGGFYSPQVIVFLSGPKHFKTGIILRVGLEYARSGMKVYYADNENGAKQIRNRAKMAIMECELHEIFDPMVKEEMDLVMYRFGHMMKGDLFVDNYPAHKKSMADVRARLLYLKEEFGWVPDLIIYDTIDKFVPINAADQKRDTRIQIQLVYDECINLNKELGTFAIVPSQVNRAGIGKKVFDIKDLAEDFAKAMNAHAIFAICATEPEIETGIRRIIPVAQRDGIGYRGVNLCVVKVDEKRMLVEQIDKEDYLKDVTDD
jgi:replicative DNA helicase